MKKIALLAASAAFALSACGATDDPDAPAEADTVEMPADEVMVQPGMDEDPAVDETITDDTAPVAEETTAPADDAADAAADAAADIEAAMGE
ncbi:hypothetical protein EKN06_07580 [Croceicoccus ponticola]|uniref:Uncharacterized protein n=1 Tax=Croceicoccus ponticola TaxID=2217664 RepID=A0A437GZ62_9SPHN|nr:hypothetical protein [Croceicoccus ponticola]RVQ67775.1 hypothetical protein EKN06_07580 [Croceicoccus ponticola]